MNKNPLPFLFWNPRKSFLSPLKNIQFIYYIAKRLNNRGGRSAVFFLGYGRNKAAIVLKKKLCRKNSVFSEISVFFPDKKREKQSCDLKSLHLSLVGFQVRKQGDIFFPWLVTLSRNFVKTLKFDDGGNFRGALLTTIRKIWSKAHVKRSFFNKCRSQLSVFTYVNMKTTVLPYELKLKRQNVRSKRCKRLSSQSVREEEFKLWSFEFLTWKSSILLETTVVSFDIAYPPPKTVECSS